MKKTIISILVLVILIIVAVVMWQGSVRNTPVASDGYKTYTNDAYSFSVVYEADRTPRFERGVKIYGSTDTKDIVHFDAPDQSRQWNEEIAIASTAATSVPALLGQWATQGKTAYSVDKQISVGGQTAFLTHRMPGKDQANGPIDVFLIKDGSLYDISLWNIDQDKVLASFKFTR